MVRRWIAAVFVVISLAVLPGPVNAAEPANRGLFVTPIREYVSVAAGGTKNGTFTVANITKKPLTVTLSVEQFSVTDFTYDYQFRPAREKWVTLGAPQIELQPGKSKAIPFTVAAPKNTAPGGHYFTLFASADLKGGAVGSKVRAASVLYVTVGGNLKKTSEITKETFPLVSFGGDTTVNLDVKNTGNTHFFIYVYGKLSGWTAKTEVKEVTHILLPATVRTVGASVQAPLLPGIYTAQYGYKTEGGQLVERTKPFIYAPLWSFVIPLGLGWLAWMLVKRHARKKAIDSSQQRYT